MISIVAVKRMGLACALALMLTGCVRPEAVSETSVSPKGSGSVSPRLEAARSALAEGSTVDPTVKLDERGRMQVYVHCSRLEKADEMSLKTAGLNIQLANSSAGIVQGWVAPEHLADLAELEFVTRVTEPSYGAPR